MKQLIVKSDIDKFRSIASAFDGERNIDGYILEAQLMDLKAWLGDAFLYELCEQRATNSLTDANKLLLYGGSYTATVCNVDQTFYLEGLAACLAFYTHARYTLRSQVQQTRFGAVVKESDYSTPASGKQIAEIKQISEENAEALKQDCILLIRRKIADYPLYTQYTTSEKRRSKINVVGE